MLHLEISPQLLEQINISPSAALMCLKAFVETVEVYHFIVSHYRKNNLP